MDTLEEVLKKASQRKRWATKFKITPIEEVEQDDIYSSEWNSKDDMDSQDS